jgi:hypothetical protein
MSNQKKRVKDFIYSKLEESHTTSNHRQIIGAWRSWSPNYFIAMKGNFPPLIRIVISFISQSKSLVFPEINYFEE